MSHSPSNQILSFLIFQCFFNSKIQKCNWLMKVQVSIDCICAFWLFLSSVFLHTNSELFKWAHFYCLCINIPLQCVWIWMIYQQRNQLVNPLLIKKKKRLDLQTSKSFILLVLKWACSGFFHSFAPLWPMAYFRLCFHSTHAHLPYFRRLRVFPIHLSPLCL